jgi:hypothetical protein
MERDQSKVTKESAMVAYSFVLWHMWAWTPAASSSRQISTGLGKVGTVLRIVLFHKHRNATYKYGIEPTILEKTLNQIPWLDLCKI